MRIILIDKPAGLTSAEASRACCPGAGHAGTLDKQATGLLLVFCGEARKLVPLAQKLDKEYEGVIHLHQPIPQKAIQAAIKKFTGTIIQTPPVKAAVTRLPRKRKVYTFEIERMEGKDVFFRISCQAGTYVRKIASDLGQQLGCSAHLKALRRTRIGPFTLPEELTPEEFVGRLPVGKVWIKEKSIQKARYGHPLEPADIEQKESGEPIVLFAGQQVVGLAHEDNKKIIIDRMLKPESDSL